MSMDFKNARLPELRPLQGSFTQNKTEAEVKQLALDLFQKTLAEKTFDVNVIGAAHLGSLDSVRKSVNWDGLALLPGTEGDEGAAMRYLYRAWQSRDVQGRGMHFLRSYLQLLFPNLCRVEQMWQEKDTAYPHGLHSAIDPEDVIDPETMYLTSRVLIALDLTVSTRSITQLTNIFRSILPARLVPQFLFWIIFGVKIDYKVETHLLMQKESEARLLWCVRRVTDNPKRKWKLGKNAELATAPKLARCYLRTHLDAQITWEGVVFREARFVSARPEHIWWLGRDDDLAHAPRLGWSRMEIEFTRQFGFNINAKLDADVDFEMTKVSGQSWEIQALPPVKRLTHATDLAWNLSREGDRFADRLIWTRLVVRINGDEV